MKCITHQSSISLVVVQPVIVGVSVSKENKIHPTTVFDQIDMQALSTSFKNRASPMTVGAINHTLIASQLKCSL